MHQRFAARTLAVATAASLLSACGGSGGSGGMTPGGGGGHVPPPNTAFTCPTADSPTSVSVGAGAQEALVRRAVSRAPLPATVAPSGAIAVTYRRSIVLSAPASVAAREQAAGATLVRALDFSHIGLVTRMISVPVARVDSVIAQMRSAPGVVSVNDASARRYPLTVNKGYFPSDPYFDGFAVTAVPTPPATPPPATNADPPYYESNDVPGQWDMHAIQLEHAFEYSQSSNGSTVQNANALGSSSVSIAVIDTGQDTGHAELNTKVVYQKCFITNSSNVQSTSNFTTDPQGHGTDTAGIAAADTGNGLGFTGAGGNVVLYAYRVFPVPDNNCSSPTTSDPQCSATLQDIASAIDDAVSHHVNVISMSLGDNCPDSPPESTAVANAIAAGVIVVAASGNAGGSGIDAPACDPGVIAVGATSLDDGSPNGTSPTGGNAGGTPSSPKEYVASYSQYGSPGANPKNATAWGIVAPGGDATSSADADNLHWIENIWTSTPWATSDAGNCNGDYPTDAGSGDCRILVDGTSMSTPHVAGAAALVLSVNSSYQSASAMKQLLCTTADDIADPHQGCGRLNVYRAMAKALNDPTLP
ncbi:MAG: S8 family peptidase [Candidatus Tyrphobacter sp.]